MNYHVLTLFPEMIEQGMGHSITGRAIKNEHIHLNVMNIRDFTENKHRKVDDYPDGGGAGMVMQPQPVYASYEKAKEGEAVLLSPACASWGMFPNYEVRGRMFKELVHKLKES